MNRFFKLLLKVVGLNLVFFLLCLAPSFWGDWSGYDALGAFLVGLIIIGLSLFIQLVVGIVYSVGEKRKELGQALLLSSGIFLLIGLSVCGGLGMV
jgi:hypothetical protein